MLRLRLLFGCWRRRGKLVNLQGEFTAATLAIGVDIFDLEPFVNHKMSKRPRRVRSVIIAGGAGVADCTFDLWYGTKLIAYGLYNVATGLQADTNMTIPIAGGDICRVDEPIKLVVTDAGNTNPYTVKVTIS